MKHGLAFILAISLCGCAPALAAEGFATYYTAKSCAKEAKDLNLKGSYWGAQTANGEAYDEKAMTCALQAPLKYGESGKTYFVIAEGSDGGVFVRHNDSGPAKKPRSRGVIIDLTPAAFLEVCGDLSKGKCKVNVQEVI